MLHLPGALLSTIAPNCLIALAVASTSSASRSPVVRVSPTDKAARISALWEIDLSPGMPIVPLSGQPDDEIILIGE